MYKNWSSTSWNRTRTVPPFAHRTPGPTFVLLERAKNRCLQRLHDFTFSLRLTRFSICLLFFDTQYVPTLKSYKGNKNNTYLFFYGDRLFFGIYIAAVYLTYSLIYSLLFVYNEGRLLLTLENTYTTSTVFSVQLTECWC